MMLKQDTSLVSTSQSADDQVWLGNSQTHVFRLENGMILAIDEQFEIDMVAFYLRMNTGAISEGKHTGSGLSHLLEHAMFLGCKSIPKQDGFSSVIETLGGVDLNAYTTYDHTAYFATVFASKLQPALKALKDFTFNPLFPEKALKEEMGTIRSEMQMVEDRASWVFHDAIQALAYPNLPYAYPIIGFKDLFSKLSRKDVATYHRKQYTPQNMILSLRGAVNVAKTVKFIEKLFQTKATVQDEANVQDAADPVLADSKIRSVRISPQQSTKRIKKPKPQAIGTVTHPRAKHIQLAYIWETPTFGAADDVLINLFDSFLTGGSSTPLYHRLKEELSLVESIYAHAFIPVPYFKNAHGIFSIYVKIIDPKNPRRFKKQIDQLTNEIFSTLQTLTIRNIQTKPTKRRSLTKLLMGLQNETIKEIIDEKEHLLDSATNIATSLHATGKSHYALTYLAKVKAMTLPNLLNGIEQYLVKAPYKLAVLTPVVAKGYSALLKAYSPNIVRYPFKQKNHKIISSMFTSWQTPIQAPQTQTNLHKHSVSTPSRPNTLLRPHKTTLTNGSTFISEPKTSLPKVSLVIRWKGGQAFEGEHAIAGSPSPTGALLRKLAAKHQLTHIPYGTFTLLSKLLLTSNAQYPKKTLHEILKIHAIDCEAHSGTGSLSIGFSYLKDKHPVVKKILASILGHSDFKKKDFIKEKQNLKFQIQRETESLSRLSVLGFNQVFYENTPYAFPLKGTETTVETISLALLNDLGKTFFTGMNMAVSLKGDFTTSEADELTRLLTKLPRTSSSYGTGDGILAYPKYRLGSLKQLPDAKRFIKRVESTAQETHLKLGFRAPALKSRSTLLVAVIKSYLAGMGGPLFKLRSADFIRDGESLGGRAYTLGCSSHAEKDFGAIVFYAALRKEAREEYVFMRKAFLNEVRKLQQNPLTQKKLQAAKDSIRAAFMMNACSSFYHASLETLYQLYGMPFLGWRQKLSQLDKITATDIQDAARQFFRSDAFIEHVMQGSNR